MTQTTQIQTNPYKYPPIAHPVTCTLTQASASMFLTCIEAVKVVLSVLRVATPEDEDAGADGAHAMGGAGGRHSQVHLQRLRPLFGHCRTHTKNISHGEKATIFLN